MRHAIMSKKRTLHRNVHGRPRIMRTPQCLHRRVHASNMRSHVCTYVYVHRYVRTYVREIVHDVRTYVRNWYVRDLAQLEHLEHMTRLFVNYVRTYVRTHARTYVRGIAQLLGTYVPGKHRLADRLRHRGGEGRGGWGMGEHGAITAPGSLQTVRTLYWKTCWKAARLSVLLWSSRMAKITFSVA